MRQLTITRTKTWVGCAAALRVLIEDAEHGSVLINGIKCRLLGKLRNGETQSWEIDGESRRVFVIADRLSKNICNEFKTIPAGEEDVLLTGRPRFSLVTGNAFRFDGVAEPEVLANRKKSKIKGGIVLAIALVVGLTLGFVKGLLSEPDEKNFTYRGMTITLTEEFEQNSDVEGDVDVAYWSEYIGVEILHESIAGYPELAGMTPAEYAEILIEANELDPSLAVKSEDGLTWVEFTEKLDDGNTLQNYMYTYVTDDLCCAVFFFTYVENVESFREDITAWAKSVTFAE